MMKLTTFALFMIGFTVNLNCSAVGTIAYAESFDKPVRQVVVNLGRSPYLMRNDPSRIQLFCLYYPAFMVKELNNPGLKGTRWVTVTPIFNDDAPKCQLAHAPTERFLAKEWWSFEGVKGSLLFLEAADGDGNGGNPFRVLDVKTGKKVFEDSVYFYRASHIEFVRTAGKEIKLKYLRVVGGDCSIPKDGSSCWSQFRKHYGVVFEAVPACMGYLKAGDKEGAMAPDGTVLAPAESTSVVAYPVLVTLLPHPMITPVSGPVKCGPKP